MRVSRDYAFDMITRLGGEISKCADAERAGGQKFTGQRDAADRLWDIKRALEYKDITPKETMRRLFRLAETNKALVSEPVRELLRNVAL